MPSYAQAFTVAPCCIFVFTVLVRHWGRPHPVLVKTSERHNQIQPFVPANHWISGPVVSGCHLRRFSGCPTGSMGIGLILWRWVTIRGYLFGSATGHCRIKMKKTPGDFDFDGWIHWIPNPYHPIVAWSLSRHSQRWDLVDWRLFVASGGRRGFGTSCHFKVLKKPWGCRKIIETSSEIFRKSHGFGPPFRCPAETTCRLDPNVQQVDPRSLGS